MQNESVIQFNIAGKDRINNVQHLRNDWHEDFSTYSLSAGKSNSVNFIKGLYPNRVSFAFGDAENDINMFKDVDYSYALNNACNELKIIASKTLKHNVDDNAVAYEINKIADAIIN